MIYQILNGFIQPDNTDEAYQGGEKMKDGWYVDASPQDDYDHGPFADEATASYVSFLADASTLFLGQEESGHRLQALIDLRVHIQKRMEDLLI